MHRRSICSVFFSVFSWTGLTHTHTLDCKYFPQEWMHFSYVRYLRSMHIYCCCSALLLLYARYLSITIRYLRVSMNRKDCARLSASGMNKMNAITQTDRESGAHTCLYVQLVPRRLLFFTSIGVDENMSSNGGDNPGSVLATHLGSPLTTKIWRITKGTWWW